MTSYQEYCPIAVGAELFGDRWTPLIVRELILGSTRFNEIHRGLARMSRSLLAQRLRELERRGIVVRETGGGTPVYRLTDAGRELEPVVWALGDWAARWSFGDPADDELDVSWLVWRLHQYLEPARLPPGRTVIQVITDGPGGGEGWLVVDRGESTACKSDPGFDVDIVLTGDNRALHRWILGWHTFAEVRSSEAARLIGPSRLARSFAGWFREPMFARSLRRSEPRQLAG
ncbi:MAG TPA: helix-turn-helix domain-containing protein [Candidatus Limnocylindrales bacterium]|jgi:DNA-binding HxlR family transcriptional regulator|nr:helix-turn-helix domain-containing protein [Candidatus Limnocylindrales bacterium]